MNEHKETKTDFLINRITQNENNQTIDINKWAFDNIRTNNEPINILELCCGTGKQTDYLLKSFPNATVSCLDASEDAINAVSKNHAADLERMTFFPMGIDDFFMETTGKFDLIFCSYGLYYSKDINFVLGKINERLNLKGKLIVMGPYGENNKQLFDILLKLNVHISDSVISSSSTFMTEKVLAFSVKNCNSIHIYTTSNDVNWQSTESVLSYWKNSTFFDACAEKEFVKIVEEKIQTTGKLVNTKKIMLIEAIKND